VRTRLPHPRSTSPKDIGVEFSRGFLAVHLLHSIAPGDQRLTIVMFPKGFVAPLILAPLAHGCRNIRETLSPRSAINVGGSVGKKVTMTSFFGSPSQV